MGAAATGWALVVLHAGWGEAWAQDVPSVAEQHEQRGLRFLQQKRYMYAVAAFKQSLATDPSRVMNHYRLGSTYELLDDLCNAYHSYLAFLRADRARESAWRALALQKRKLIEDRKEVAPRVNLTATPAETQVAIVRPAALARPLGRADRGTVVPPGKLVLRFSAKGYFSQEREVKIGYCEVITLPTVHLELVVKEGFLTLRCNVEGAHVVIDEKGLGKTPLKPRFPLSAGEHQLKVVKDGYHPQAARFRIDHGTGVDLSILLLELPRQPRRPYRYGAYAAWITAGAAAASGLGFYLGAVGKHDEYLRTEPTNEALLKEAKRLGRTATVLTFGVGGSALLTGLLLYFLAPKEPVSIDVNPVPGGVTSAISGRF